MNNAPNGGWNMVSRKPHSDYEVPILLDGKYEDLDEFGKASIDAFRGTFHELDMPPEHAEKDHVGGQ